MPTYDLPALPEKSNRESMPEPAGMGGTFPDEYDRQVRIPVNAAILAAIAAGQDIEVTLRGEVIEIQANESAQGGARRMITLQLASVSAYPNQETYDTEDMERGFNRGPRPLMR